MQIPCRVGYQRGRQTLTASCLHQIVKPRQVKLQNLTVQEQYCGLSLILSRCRDTTIDGQISQECLDLRGTHLCRVAKVVKANEATHPLKVSLFGAIAVMQGPDTVTHLEKQPGWRIRGRD